MRPRRVVGVEWTRAAAADAAARVVHVAVREGGHTSLHAAAGPDAAIALVVDLAMEEPETLIGLGFALSVTGEVARARGWRSAGEVWRAAATGEAAGAAPEADLQGMARLMLLCDAGVGVWPFDPVRLPLAVGLTPDPAPPGPPDRAAARAAAALAAHLPDLAGLPAVVPGDRLTGRPVGPWGGA
jgi:hypothetical protein